MKNTRLMKILKTSLPVLSGFFVMGFCDIVGISSDYAASAFGWSATVAPSLGRYMYPLPC